MKKSVVTAQSLGHQFQNKILFQNLSFELSEGELAVVTGPSGQGKSTLLKIIFGIEMARHGQILNKTRTCYQPQDLALSAKLTAIENVLIGHRIQFSKMNEQIFIENPQAEQKAQALLQSLGIDCSPQKSTSNYSGGEQQRIAFARSLMTQAPLLLLDEPFSQLDWDRSIQLMQMIRDECTINRRSALVIVHDQRLADKFADQILHLGTLGHQ